jgi:hypothetical protein
MATKAILRAAAATSALVFGWVGLAMMNDEPPAHPAARPAPPRRVSVRLLGPASAITGVAIPSHVLAAKRGSDFFQIDEPAVVALTLPDGKKVSLPVNMAFVTTHVDFKTKSAVVVDVALLPLLKSVPYREAIAEMRRLMHEMGIEPDERMRTQMAKWPDDSGPIDYRAAMDINEDYGLSVDLRTAPYGGWFIVFTFEAGVDVRRSLWDSNFKFTRKPPPEERKVKEVRE